MATLHVSIDLPEWDDPVEGYKSLQGEIVREAVRQLFDALRRDLEQTITNQLDEQIRKQLAEILTDIVETPIQKTNSYGEPRGEPVSLRERIIKHAEDWLQEAVDEQGKTKSYHRDKTMPRAEWMTKRAVRSQLYKLYHERIAEAVQQAKDTLNDELENMIKDAIKSKLNL